MKRLIFICILISLFHLTFCQLTETNKSLRSTVKQGLNSSKDIRRRVAIKTIGEKKLINFAPDLIKIIQNPNYDESERYLAARSLALTLQKKVLKDVFSWLNQEEPILKNCALEVFITLLKMKYPLSNPNKLGQIIAQILDETHFEMTIKKASVTLVLLNYSKAYPILLKLIRSRTGVYDEVITSLALLGNDDRNWVIERAFISLISQVRDKRLLRSIKKGFYILRNHNKSLPIFEGTLIKKLSDLGSDHFVSSYQAEKYFYLFEDTTENIRRRLGTTETSNPKTIKEIKLGRVPLLIFALEDTNSKIRFKAAKLLGDLGDASCCKPLLKAYKRQSRFRVPSRIVLLSLAKLNCQNIFPTLASVDSKTKLGYALFTFLQQNRSFPLENKAFFHKNPLLFSQKELFPKDLNQIDFLLSHPNKLVRIQALYSLFQSNIKGKIQILKKRIKLEKDNSIRDFFFCSPIRKKRFKL